jgi:hypothetical protein
MPKDNTGKIEAMLTIKLAMILALPHVSVEGRGGPISRVFSGNFT